MSGERPEESVEPPVEPPVEPLAPADVPEDPPVEPLSAADEPAAPGDAAPPSPAAAASDDEIDMDSELHRLKSHRRAASEPAEPTPADDAKERRRPPRKASQSSRDELSEAGRRPGARRGARRTPSREQTPAEPEIEEDEATRERKALEARIDAALQPSSKRRKKLAGDDLEALQDEAVAQLRDAMRDAALRDVECIREGQPAINKVKMLPEVVDMVQKMALADSILDGNLLESVRIWLEPLPDASLPSFEIQKAMFEALVKLPIKTIHLRESGLGRVVLFYQKSKRPQPAIKRMAQKLIGDWTRPIIGRSDNYRDKRVATAEFDPDALGRAAATAGLARRGEPMSSYEEAAARRGRAAIPSASGVSYQVAPLSSGPAYAGDAQLAAPGAAKDSQLRRMKAKLMTSGRSGRKKSQVSVEGRGLN